MKHYTFGSCLVQSFIGMIEELIEWLRYYLGMSLERTSYGLIFDPVSFLDFFLVQNSGKLADGHQEWLGQTPQDINLHAIQQITQDK